MLITKKMVEDAPNGIAYAVGGHAKEHIMELTGLMEGILSGSGESLTDEELASSVLRRLKDIEADQQEIANGMNTLHDIMRAAGLVL